MGIEKIKLSDGTIIDRFVERSGNNITGFSDAVTKPLETEEVTPFNKWWNENHERYSSDALHMSEYHMAHEIWNASRNVQFSERQQIVKSGAKKQMKAYLDNRLLTKGY